MKKQSKFSVLIAILLSIITTSCNSQNQPLDSIQELQTSDTVSELVSAMEEPDYTITTTQQEWNDQIYTIYKMKTDTYEEILEPPLSETDIDRPVPDFLDEEQQLLYLRACSVYPTFSGYPFKIDDTYPRKDGKTFDHWANHVYYPPENSDFMYYYAAQGRYEKWDDFVGMGTSIFTSVYFNQRSSCFLNMNGYTYIPDAEKGCGWGYLSDTDTFTLISKSDTEIHFELIGHYYDAHAAQDEDSDFIITRTRNFPIIMVLTDEGWRFSEFHMAAWDD